MELELRNVSVRRNSRSVLEHVDLCISSGERIAIMGANGSGKSTLGLALAGALAPAAGARSGSAVNYTCAVLQRPEASFLAETVIAEVALGAAWAGASAQAASSAASAALVRLGLDASYAQRDPLMLSGGEQRRVAIAAVLATHPRVVILDEPSAGLDVAARRALQEVIAGMHEAGRALVTITHDAEEAARVADRLIVLDAGRVVYDGALEPVLGDVDAAAGLGLQVAPEVQVLDAISRTRGVATPVTAHPARALDLAREIGTTGPATRTPRNPVAAGSPHTTRTVIHDVRSMLPRAIDARLRILAACMVTVAVLLAHTAVVVFAIAAALSLLLAASPQARRHARFAIRPVVTIAVMLVALQYAFGQHVNVEIIPGTERAWPWLVALRRAAQIGSVLVVSLVLTSATTAPDIGAALRWLLTPLRALRVPVDDVALVVATALAILPALDAELERIRMARSARGIRARARSIIERIRLESLVLMPVLVTSFRRARLLADALVVRGVDPRAPVVEWRARSIPLSDVFGALSAMILVVAAWLA